MEILSELHLSQIPYYFHIFKCKRELHIPNILRMKDTKNRNILIFADNSFILPVSLSCYGLSEGFGN